MSKKERGEKLSAEEREILRARCRAVRWAYQADNMRLVMAEYRRRYESLNESLLGAFRRALWTTYRRYGNAN